MNPQPRILIADDEETFLYATAELLRQEGYHCDTAMDSTHAVALMRQNQYDVLLSDIRMPGNEHLQFIEQLEELAQDIPVILITGYPSVDTALDSYKLSVTAYLVKPTDFEDILKAIKDALG